MLRITPYNAVTGTVTWQVNKLVEEAGLTSVVGAPNVGKTFLVVDIACSVASGVNCLNDLIPVKQGNVLILPTESVSGVKARIDAWKTEREVEISEDALFIGSTGTVDLTNDEDLMEMELVIREHEVKLVIIDTWSLAIASCEENSASDTNALIQKINYLRGTYGCSFILVHHMGKDQKGARGSSALLGAVDTELSARVMKDPKDDAEYSVLTCSKQRNGQKWKEGINYIISDNGEDVGVLTDVTFFTPERVKGLKNVRF